MEPKVNYLLVGLFLVLLGVASLAGVLWLSRTDYRGVYDRFYSYMEESVSGLSRDSYVKYRGVEVGRVKEILLDPDNPENVRLELELLRGTPIKEDTVAVLETQGLTGITTVNLRGGTRAAPSLKAKGGEKYPVIKSQPSFLAELTQNLQRIMANEQLPALLANLNNLTQEARSLVDTQSRADLKRILADLAQVTRTIASQRNELAASIEKAAAAMDRFAALGKHLDERVPQLLDQTSENLQALRALTAAIARTNESVSSALDDSRGGITQFSAETLPETSLLVAEFRQLTATLQRLANELEREPNALIFGRSAPLKGPGE